MIEPAAHEAWLLHAFLWAAFVVACGAAALPLCTRVLRSLPDRGAFAAAPVGLLLATWFAWLFALRNPEGWTAANHVRALCLVAAAATCVPAWLATRAKSTTLPRRLGAWWPTALLAALGAIPLPHGAFAVWLSLLCVAASSLAAVAGERERRRLLRDAVRPFIAAQTIFLAGFVFFAVVRSFLPWAHWDPGYSAAEKFGNLMHLGSAMRSRAMPPADAWMFGLPTNYYYGGHLIVASIAKATGTSASVAFNLGLATIVGLTLSGGFGLSANMLAGAGPLRLGRLRTIAVGAGGAVAIAFFGNVDGLVQILERGLHRTTFEHYDFWRSSRVIFSATPSASGAGTITEFPWFSAILGDLHPHHMALPFSLALLMAFVAIHRSAIRGVHAGAAWLRRCGVTVAAAGAMLGFVFAINIWDAVVFGPILLAVVALSMKGVAWNIPWLASARRLCTVAALALGAALLLNAAPDSVPVFGVPLGLAAALVALGVFWAAPMSPELRRPLAWTVPAACGVLVLAGGWNAGLQHATAMGKSSPHAAALAAGVRDAAILAGALGTAWLLCGRTAAMRGWFPALVAWSIAGVLALLVASPFKAFFASPVGTAQPILVSLLPPVPSTSLIGNGTGIAERFWQRMVATPFDDALRTRPGEVLVYWGQFLVPILALLAARVDRVARSRGLAPVACIAGISIGAGAWMFNELQSVTAPLAVLIGALCALVAWQSRRQPDAALWMLLAGAMACLVFVETLHFDDNYVGDYERYNTPFKILYPLWPVLAVGMIAAFAGFERWLRGRTGFVASAAATAALFMPVAVVGFAYPIASTATRTRAFGAFPPHSTLEQNHPRSLDATAWLLHTNDAAIAADAKIAAWLKANAEPGAGILEAPAPHDRQSYTYHGRFAAMTGMPGVSGWPHHEMQWRGWGTAVPEHIDERFSPFFPEEKRASGISWLDVVELARGHAQRILEAREWDPDTVALLRLYRVRYVALGSLERTLLAGNDAALAKLESMENVFNEGDFGIYRVPDSMIEEAAP